MPAHKIPLIDRFRTWTVREPDGCWLWQGHIDAGGYAYIKHEGVNRRAHKVAYEYYIGKVPEGLHLDHLCRVRHCVNPLHLEPVTPRENVVVRGIGCSAANARKTHCDHGHEF